MDGCAKLRSVNSPEWDSLTLQSQMWAITRMIQACQEDIKSVKRAIVPENSPENAEFAPIDRRPTCPSVCDSELGQARFKMIAIDAEYLQAQAPGGNPSELEVVSADAEPASHNDRSVPGTIADDWTSKS